MAEQSILLRDVCAYNDVRKIAMSRYPIFNENYRAALNDKILVHYWMQEIGVESVSLFMHHLSRKMNEIMPEYNQWYESTLIEFDPMSTIDMKAFSTNSAESEVTGLTSALSSGEGSTGSRAVSSDYPQNMLSGREDYASSGTDTHGNSTQQGHESSKSDARTADQGQGEQTTKGRTASGSAMLQELRASIVNVDLMVISELSSLFMGVWSGSDYERGFPSNRIYY